MWIVLPTFAVYIATRTSGRAKVMKSTASGMQMTGSVVGSSSARQRRSRNATTAGRPIRSTAPSHMFTWCVEPSVPVWYSITSGPKAWTRR